MFGCNTALHLTTEITRRYQSPVGISYDGDLPKTVLYSWDTDTQYILLLAVHHSSAKLDMIKVYLAAYIGLISLAITMVLQA